MNTQILAVGKGRPNIEEILKADIKVEVPEGWHIGEVKSDEMIDLFLSIHHLPAKTSFAAMPLSEETTNKIKELMK